MKCSHCPFLINVGTYEYPEWNCQFFFRGVPQEFESKDHEGCNLKYLEAKKLASLEDVEFYGYLIELRNRRI